MPDRMMLGPDGVRISRPGIDVKSPPSLTEEHLVIDWTWPAVERLHHYGRVLGASIVGSSFSFYFPALSFPPLVAVMLSQGNVYFDEMFSLAGIRSINGVGYLVYASNFDWVSYTDRITVTWRYNATTPITSFDWTFCVFRP